MIGVATSRWKCAQLGVVCRRLPRHDCGLVPMRECPLPAQGLCLPRCVDRQNDCSATLPAHSYQIQMRIAHRVSLTASRLIVTEPKLGSVKTEPAASLVARPPARGRGDKSAICWGRGPAFAGLLNDYLSHERI